jgi:membrane peptidoglycan carboxypeptidase
VATIVRAASWIPRLALVIAAGVLLITATVVGVAPRLWSAANAHDELPVTLPPFEALAQSTYVYDVNGNEIGVFELENSQPLKFADIPPQVVQAFLVVEDKEFFNHHGVNVRSLVRATLSNFASDSPQQGASTITMQVVKNDFLAGLERDSRYKALQIHYAEMLEKEVPKEQILERYLNTVFFGNNAYGIQAAAETYFGKTASELTFIEAAFLAGLVRSPSGFDPINSPERSRARWLQVLDRLASDNYITQADAKDLAVSFVLPERVKTLPSRSAQRSYFTEALRDYLLNRSSILGDTYEERYKKLFRGGLRIHTTLDSNLQAQAEQARNALPDTPQGFDAAIVSLDSTSAAIRVMVGGRGFVPKVRETNMALAPRQTGSSIKLFILSAAVQAGAQPGDVIDGTAPCALPDPNDARKPFVITDAVSRGVAPLTEQTWLSINCAYARLSQIVGLNRVVDTTYRMAESPYLYKGQPASDRTPIQPFASFATGANEMSPLDMAAGIQTLANDGVHYQPYYVDSIDDADGNRLYTHVDPGTKVLEPEAARQTVDILKGVLTRGTARKYPLDGGRPAFGKTGTQASNTNAWFAGGTRQLSTAVWVGDPDAYTQMRNIKEFVAQGVPRVQGGTFPAKIWKTFMDPANAAFPADDWAPPPPPKRPNARLFLPGNECVVAPAPTVPPDPNAPATTIDPAAPPPTTQPPVVVAKVGTTIPPDVLDPLAPMPTIAIATPLGPCAAAKPGK